LLQSNFDPPPWKNNEEFGCFSHTGLRRSLRDFCDQTRSQKKVASALGCVFFMVTSTAYIWDDVCETSDAKMSNIGKKGIDVKNDVKWKKIRLQACLPMSQI